MVDLVSQTLRRAGTWDDAIDTCVLTYEDRLLRRKVLQTAQGEQLLVDLPRMGG